MSPAEKHALIVLPVDRPGGAERVACCVANALAARPEWQVEILVLAARAERSFLADNCAGIAVRHGAGEGRFGAELGLLRRLGGRKYQLVFSTHARVNAALSLLRSIGRLKCERLVARESTLFAERYSGLRLFCYRLLYRCYGAQNLIVAQSPCMADRLRAVLPADTHSLIRVVANPVDVASIDRYRRAGLSAATRVLVERLGECVALVWCGRFIDTKRPLAAVALMASLCARAELNCRLVMIGTGPLSEEVGRAIDRAALGERVLLAGQLDNPYAIFASCRVGILTSASEGFPNVLLEMVACGVERVFSTPCAGDLDSIPGVEVVAGFSVECMAEAVLAYLNGNRPAHSSELRVALGRSPGAAAAALIDEAE
jgi:hypothetical protein